MLTTARPIFESVPGSFCDPAGLAEQQAPGVVALIVVRYPTTDDPPSVERRADGNSPPAAKRIGEVPRSGEGVLGPIYDAFVAVSGRLLTVARTTPDYRFPVMPATALSRFFEHRDAGRPVALSLYQLDEAECARFLETVFYAECLKLHVEGAESAALVAGQVARSGCADGVLELNDFSDPAAPRLHLIDLAQTDVTDPAESSDTGALPPLSPSLRGSTAHRGGGQGESRPQAGEGGLTETLRSHLDGVTGRVLLYDRHKNQAVAADRTGRAFDLDATIEQANRLAAARRGHRTASTDAERARVQTTAPTRTAERTTSETDHEASPEPPPPPGPKTVPDREDAAAEHVETYLRDRAARPRLVEPSHPNAAGLAALVAELQGGAPLAPTEPAAATGEGPAPESTPDAADADPDQSANPNALPCQEGRRTAPQRGQRGDLSSAGGGGPEPVAYSPKPPHPLAVELDRLRTDTFALFEDAVDRERALAHRAHVLAEHAIPSPVPPVHVVAYLRALLTDDPPRRWHFFKRQRAKTYEAVAARLLAFHGAHAHTADPDAQRTLDEIAKLWSRLHK